MLEVKWFAADHGAPQRKPGKDNSEYWQAIDQLLSPAGQVLQEWPRADAALPPLSPAFDHALAQWLGAKTRVVVMVHGFWYDPTGVSAVGGDDPKTSVYGDPRQVAPGLSWLPLVGEFSADGASPGEDLAIGYSWCSDSSLTTWAGAGWTNFYQYALWDQARLAARGLAFVLAWLVARRVRVNILAHSLGTRVVSQAIGMLSAGKQDGTIGRLVLLDGAEFVVDADHSLGGRAFQTFNIVNREDHVLTLGASQMCHPLRYVGTDAARVIGRDGVSDTHRWVDIQLDRESARDWLRLHGYAVSPDPEPDDPHTSAWARHWVCYTHPGNRVLVRALIGDDSKTVDWFRLGGFPAGTDASYYGHFRPFVPKTPADVATRMAAQQWNYNDFEAYNGL